MNILIRSMACLGMFVCVLLSPITTKADLTLTPTRVVFEDGDRFAKVTLVNSTNRRNTYNVGWVFYKMVEGRMAPYEPVEGSITDFDLTQYIVYTPRRVTLAPGGKQKIRLALRRPDEVPPGEYRAHMAFQPVPEEELPAESSGETRTQSASVKVNVGFSIPVIFQAGEEDVAARIDSFALQRNQNSGMLEAMIKVDRIGGPYSILGHLYIYNANGDVIGETSNAHVFPEINTRTFRVPLIDENISGQDIRVVIEHFSNKENKVYAERSFPIQ